MVEYPTRSYAHRVYDAVYKFYMHSSHIPFLDITELCRGNTDSRFREEARRFGYRVSTQMRDGRMMLVDVTAIPKEPAEPPRYPRPPFTRQLTDREKLLLTAALMNQARLERAQPVNPALQTKLYDDFKEDSLEDLDEFLRHAKTREHFFEFFATLVQRGYIKIMGPILIPPKE